MSDSSKKVSIRILATSDVHGRFVPYDFAADEESSIGSMTYLSGLIAQHRKENANVILVDCGDSVQANMSELLVVTEEQHPMILAYNYLHYDIWNLGNHEFNFPTKIRKKLADQFQGVTLCGNVFATGASESIFPDITVIEKEGVRVGFIGMVTPMIRVFETGRTNLDGCEVKEPMEVVRHSIQKLRDLGVDCIVGLIHEGIHMENAQPGTSTRELAEAYPEFDVIIGGHEHAALAQELVNGVLITQPKNDAANAAVVDLVFACSEEGTKLIEKSSALDKPECVEDEVLAEKLEYYKETLAQFSRSPVGTLIHGNLGRIPESDPFFRKLNEGSKSVYTAANSVSNLFGTACMYLTGAECVLLHSDNEYAFMSEGELFVKDISGNYQYSTGSIRVYDVNGAFLKKILEWCGAYYETFREGDRKIRFVPERRNTKYCSLFFGLGICYEIDLSQEPGKRIRNLCMIQKDQLRNPVYEENETARSDAGRPAADAPSASSTAKTKTGKLPAAPYKAYVEAVKDDAFTAVYTTTDGRVLSVTPIYDDTPIKLGTNKYYMNQWLAEGGCVAGEDPKVIFDSSKEFEGNSGTVRMMILQYIEKTCLGLLDRDDYSYENWRFRL